MWHTRTGPTPNASRSKTQAAGSAGSGGKSTRCDQPASRQKGRSNLSATFSYRPKPSRRTASSRSAGSGGVEARQVALEHAERNRDHDVGAGLGLSRGRRDGHPVVRQVHLRHRPVEAYVEPGGHGVHHGGVPALGQVPEVGVVVLVLRPQPLQRLVLGRTGRVRLDTGPQSLPGPAEGLAGEPARGQERLDPVGRRGIRAQRGRARRRERLGEPSSSTVRLASTSSCDNQQSGGARRTRSGSAAGRRADTRARPRGRSGAPGCRPGGGSRTRRGRPGTLPGPRCAAVLRPGRRASSTRQSTPAWASALATVSPAMPAPTTRTRSTAPATPPGISVCPSS